jgi:hypothetical protein
VVKPNGLLYLTVHGDAYKNRLVGDEVPLYETTGIVVRGNVAPGKAWSTAYQSPAFMETELLASEEIVYKELFHEGDTRPRQDVWVVRKRVS